MKNIRKKEISPYTARVFFYMHFLQIFLLALSLSADAFAVAVWAWISQKHINIKNALMMSGCFWFFQAFMPIIGFIAASLLPKFIMDYNYLIAFVLLGYLGGAMAYTGWKWEDEDTIKKDIFSFSFLLVLGIATSIDALAVGVSLTATETSILFPALIIGIITFGISFIGVEFGKKFWTQIGSRAEIIWWLVLFGIGANILLEHISL